MSNKIITIIGLGYVGLPLAVEFSKKYITYGFDINLERINELKNFNDKTLEIDSSELKISIENRTLLLHTDISECKNSNIFIVTVPTPVDINNRPILDPLIKASNLIGSILKTNDIVIFESTVYPGVTEDICVPILENSSKLIFNKDFFVGYSPERINPGDKVHTVKNILKVTSGSNKETAIIVNDLYKSIIDAGTYMASSIKVAEAAKIIENSQRDINIAFVNELSKIFNLMNIDTNEVLSAASTKWNFLNFKPGLVGGHCIGVDPYYLAQKAQEIGYHPEIILAGRRINDSMGKYIATQVIKLLINENILIKNSNILILGFTFKENCPDVRNTKVIDIFKELKEYSASIDVFDPIADPIEVKKEYAIDLVGSSTIFDNKYDAIILAVSHNHFIELDFNRIGKENRVIYDVKGFLNKNIVNARL